MQRLIRSGNDVYAVLFFIIVVAFGAYFIINLILAVIMASFSKFEDKEIELARVAAEEAELKRVQT